MEACVEQISACARSWAEISRAALRGNVRRVRERLPAGVGILAVVKANAYGHGLASVVPELAGAVQWFGVACVEEARQVRRLGGTHPLLILGPVLPAERPTVVRERWVPVISSWEEAAGFEAVAQAQGCSDFPVHLVVDTGMGRIGVWEEEAADMLSRMQSLSRVRIAGLGTHFPSADEDPVFTREQIRRFGVLVQGMRRSAVGALEVHVANSAGILGFEIPYATLIRPGLALYGCSPLPAFEGKFSGVMTWKSRVTLVRVLGPGRTVSYGRTYQAPHSIRVATLAVGYADGYPRGLSSRGAEVLVRGRRCPVLGRVTMDQTLVDVSACGGVEPGEEAVLLGRQGEELVTVQELAAKAGTIPWEIFTGVGTRVERVLVE